MRKSEIKNNLSALNKTLADKASLVIVSKTYPESDCRICYDLGFRDFGENHILELLEKSTQMKDCNKIRWHMIGHIQTNKIKKLFQVKNLYAIHSVDSLKLIRELIKEEKSLTSEIKVFLQVNTSLEDEKHGFKNFEEIKEAIELLNTSKYLKVYGLMTMGRIRTVDVVKDAHVCFKKLRDFRDGLNPDLKLSMGMSSDYEVALNYGTDYVRVGSKIFGSR